MPGSLAHLDAARVSRARHDVTASDRHGGRGTRDGKVLDKPICLRLRIDDGRIAEVWEFVWDLYAVDEFWT